MSRLAPNPPPGPRLCLLAEIRPGADYAASIAAALERTGAVTLILRAPAGSTPDSRATRALVALAQERSVAALVADDVAAARAAAADGVHVSWSADTFELYKAARTALGPQAIVGADAGHSRHDAMQLGEAGADYVAFGLARGSDSGDQQDAHDARLGLVEWWADLFEVPVVAIDVETAAEVEELARAGADFVAATFPPLADAAAAEAWAAAMTDAAGLTEVHRT